MQYNDFDYFGWWKACVVDMKISPEQAWQLDFLELSILFDIKSKHYQDGSMTVNEKRILNGMPRGDLKNVN